MSLLRNVFPNIIKTALYSPLTTQVVTRNFHVFSNPINTLLTPSVVSVQQNCSFKLKGKPKRRCKDCYLVMREHRLYVICEKHPRHKQMAMVKDPKSTWMLSHATQSKVRPW